MGEAYPYRSELVTRAKRKEARARAAEKRVRRAARDLQAVEAAYEAARQGLAATLAERALLDDPEAFDGRQRRAALKELSFAQLYGTRFPTSMVPGKPINLKPESLSDELVAYAKRQIDRTARAELDELDAAPAFLLPPYVVKPP